MTCIHLERDPRGAKVRFNGEMCCWWCWLEGIKSSAESRVEEPPVVEEMPAMAPRRMLPVVALLARFRHVAAETLGPKHAELGTTTTPMEAAHRAIRGRNSR